MEDPMQTPASTAIVKARDSSHKEKTMKHTYMDDGQSGPAPTPTPSPSPTPTHPPKPREPGEG